MTPAADTLLVRMPNHLGDACMALPALRRLEAAGWRPQLVGRGWLAALFAGCDWPTIATPARRRDLIAPLRARFRGARGILLTNSLSTALEFRLAGVRAAGYATDGRGWLLAERIPRPAQPLHMVAWYVALADAVLRRQGGDAARLAGAPLPAALGLPPAPGAAERALRLLAEAGVADPYDVLCPVAVGLHRGRIKAWAGFPALCRALVGRGRTVVGCPGPGETAAVTALLPGASILPPTDIGTFAALLAGSRRVVANDSGPGHVAAAVGAPLVSVFGVTQPELTQPWGPTVVRVGGAQGWPAPEEVLKAVLAERG